MNYASPTTSNSLKCNQCGSPLIVFKKKTQKIENYLSPITVTVYKCTNKQCQRDIDKKTALRKKVSKEQQSAKDERVRVKKETKIRINKKKIFR